MYRCDECQQEVKPSQFMNRTAARFHEESQGGGWWVTLCADHMPRDNEHDKE